MSGIVRPPRCRRAFRRGAPCRCWPPATEWLLDRLDPPEIAEVGGQGCLAEQAMSGARAATEGYVRDGRVVVYGVLASITYPERSSFLRHQ